MDIIISIICMFIIIAICFYAVIASKKEKRINMLIIPMIFNILLYVPGIMNESLPYEVTNKIPHLFAMLFFWIVLTWAILFRFIPMYIYIVMVIVYAVVSWSWILKLKKGNIIYAIAWIILCILSILLFWKIGPSYEGWLIQ